MIMTELRNVINLGAVWIRKCAVLHQIGSAVCAKSNTVCCVQDNISRTMLHKLLLLMQNKPLLSVTDWIAQQISSQEALINHLKARRRWKLSQKQSFL